MAAHPSRTVVVGPVLEPRGCCARRAVAAVTCADPFVSLKPGERVLASGSVQLPRFTLLESGSLLVSPSHISDAGTYTCMASNSRGIDEASADLVVWGEPAGACWEICQNLSLIWALPFSLRPVSSDPDHHAAAGPERHQRNKGLHDLRGHARPQCDGQVRTPPPLWVETRTLPGRPNQDPGLTRTSNREQRE